MKRIFVIFALHCIVCMPVVIFANTNPLVKNHFNNSQGLDTNIISKTRTTYATVYTNLLINSGNSYVLADGVATAFNNQFSPVIDANDAAKFWGYYENIAEVRNGNMLSIEFRPVPKITDTIFYKLYLRQMPYALQIFAQNFPANFPCKAWLVDSYLNTQKEINLKDTSVINFTPTADTNSFRNRFTLVFRKQLSTAPVPVSRITNQANSDIMGIANKHAAATGSASISPNPVSNASNAVIRFSNMAKGNYEMTVFNSKGQKLAVKKIQHTGKDAFYSLQTGDTWPAGIYLVLIQSEIDKSTINLQLVISK